MKKDQKINKIVLAYSGGLDTSVILTWLKETYKVPVIAFVADLGQGDDMEEVRKKALKTGASECYVEDLRDELVKEYFFPALKMNALYEGVYMMGTSIARPLIAKAQMKVAEKVKADAVSHGATGKGNDQVRFELTYYSMNPSIKVIAPWREWEFKGRSDLVAYAKKHKIPIPTTPAKPYSSDGNLIHISYESGILEDPWAEPPDDMFQMTVSPYEAPDRTTEITIEFHKGEPVSVNGKKLGPAALMSHLNKLGGQNGIGRVDMVENRYVSMKNRGVYETPGGAILHVAHRALETITVDREVYYIKDSLMPMYARMIYNGYWFSPERKALQTLIDASQEKVSGTVRLKLYKGNCIVTGRKSPNSLYSLEFATMEKDAVYNQADAEGFIKLNALRLKIAKMLGETK